MLHDLLAVGMRDAICRLKNPLIDTACNFFSKMLYRNPLPCIIIVKASKSYKVEERK
jgi:hypothetical protein